jgi:hypothetical protein
MTVSAVHAEDRGMPEGLSRVMDIMQSAIAPKSIAPGNNQQTASPDQRPASEKEKKSGK